MSAAGHIEAGDESRVTAERELGEELGVTLNSPNDLQFAMSVRNSATGETQRHGKYKDNEIQDIYVYAPTADAELQADSLTLQVEEVESVEYWKWSEYCERCNSGDNDLVPRSDEYRAKFFPWLQAFIERQ